MPGSPTLRLLSISIRIPLQSRKDEWRRGPDHLGNGANPPNYLAVLQRGHGGSSGGGGGQSESKERPEVLLPCCFTPAAEKKKRTKGGGREIAQSSEDPHVRGKGLSRGGGGGWVGGGAGYISGKVKMSSALACLQLMEVANFSPRHDGQECLKSICLYCFSENRSKQH